jgi:hypothetical protein
MVAFVGRGFTLRDVPQRKSKNVRFKYSPEQWNAILACVAEVRPGKGLTEHERKSLVDAASDYRLHLKFRQSSEYRSPNQVAHECGQIAKSIRKLRDAVLRLQTPDAIPSLPLDLGNGEKLVVASSRSIKQNQADRDTILNILNRWEEEALRGCQLADGRRIIDGFTYGRREQDRPKNVYYRAILHVWADMIGGKLRSSTSSNYVVSGPTVRFLLAVSIPVMGEAAPKSGTVADIIDREKKMRKRDASLAASFGYETEDFHIIEGFDVVGWHEI